MKRVYQTILTPPDGNCMQACIASVLGVPLDEVPNFVTHRDHWQELDLFLIRFGLYHIAIPIAEDWKPTGFHIIDGKGPRGHFHWVVGRNGEMIHDPFPGGEGLETRLYWIVFVSMLNVLHMPTRGGE